MSDYFGSGTSLAQGLKGSGYDETSALFYIACPKGKDSAVDPEKNDGVPKFSHCFAPTMSRGMKMKIKIIQKKCTKKLKKKCTGKKKKSKKCTVCKGGGKKKQK